MGCKLCKRESQIVNPIKKEEEKAITIEEDPLQFDPIKARKLIKFLLDEDKLYKKFLNAIILFTDDQIENLMKGNEDYKNYPYHNIEDTKNFERLLLKFQDHNCILFEWYKDESKYDNLIKLWKKNFCIYKLKDLSHEKLEEQLTKAGISDMDDFIVDFRSLINNSIETKACDIRKYIERDYPDFYKLIETNIDFKKDEELTKKEYNGVFEKNFENIAKKLIQTSFPLIKNFIKDKFPNLNNLSKIQLKSEMLNKLKNAIFQNIEENNSIQSSEGIGFDNISELIDAFKNGDILQKLSEGLENHYNNPTVAISHLSMSFMNLATSIKTYYNDCIKFDEQNEKFTKGLKDINNNFEKHKALIKVLDLDNYEESMKEIISIGIKINEDKKKVVEFIDNIGKEEKKIEEKDGIKKAAEYGFAAASSALGVVFTGGILAFAFAAAAIGNGIATGINIANIIELKKQLKKYKETIESYKKKQVEIETSLKDLDDKFRQFGKRYIPANLVDN